MKIRRNLLLAVILFGFSGIASALLPQCQLSYESGTSPKIVNEKMARNTQEICYQGYVTLFSGVTRTPLWSAEHLTKDRIQKACLQHRENAFHPDQNLPADRRSELSDYARSGYDRGHMAPSADMPTPSAQSESFSLANMVPQVHANNAGIWEELEKGTRNLALSGHDVYVLSGPIFEGAEIKQLKGRVMVPTSLFKAVYDATTKQAGVYLTPNTPEHTYMLVSVKDVATKVGIDPFPSIPSEAKVATIAVIEPSRRTNCGSQN